MCGEGGDVFMVPTQQGQRKPKWPTHKDPGEKRKKRKEIPNKGILLMVLVQGSHGCACKVDTWFPWMAYERPMDDALMKRKAH